MTDHERDAGAGSAAGDPMQELLLRFAANIDQLAALIGGAGADQATGAANGLLAGPLPGLVGEFGTVLKELGDLLARILAALIAVLEAVAEMLRSTPKTTAEPTRFEAIPVRITTQGTAR